MKSLDEEVKLGGTCINSVKKKNSVKVEMQEKAM